MRRLILLTLIFALVLAGLLVANYMEQSPGYVLIAWKQTTIEMSLWVFLVASASTFMALYYLARLLLWLVTTLVILFGGERQIGLFTRWLALRKNKNTNWMMDGLNYFVEGQWERARRLLARSASKSQVPVVNYVMAAQASYYLGDTNQAQKYLETAAGRVEGASLSVGLAQAELQLKSGQIEQCLATLEPLRELFPDHPVILKMLVDIYRAQSDWEKVFSLLPNLKSNKAWTKETIRELESASCAGLLEKSVPGKEAAQIVEVLHETWKKFPADITRDRKLIAIYSRRLAEAGATDEAEKLLRVAIKRQWDDVLVQQYGRIAGGDAKKRLSLAESWLKSRTDNATLLLCAGRLALNNKLWGKAREYFEASLLLEEQADTCAELGRLYAHLGDHAKSSYYFNKGVSCNNRALPDLPMPDEQKKLQVLN